MVPKCDRNSFYAIIGSFLVLSFLISIVGYFAYKSEKEKTITAKKEELFAISKLKADQIADWFHDLNAYSTILSDGSSYARDVEKYLSDRSNKELEERVKARLLSYVKAGDLYSGTLFDPGSKKVFTVGKDMLELSDSSRAKRAMTEGVIINSDIHLDPGGKLLHLDIIVPLKITEKGKTRVVAAAILTIDPGRHLFPLVLSWPTESPSSETQLVEKQGNEAIFLNELKFNKDSALKLKIPMSRDEAPAVKAAKGLEGVFDGVDYRGVKVVSATRKIAGSPWSIVSKTDYDEIVKPLFVRRLWISGATIALILLMGFILANFWAQQKHRWLEENYEAALRQKALEKHYEYISKYANDIIFMADENFRIIYSNPKASEVYGYSEEEFKKMTIMDQRGGVTGESVRKDLSGLTTSSGAVFEIMHKKKDGTLFPVENSARLFEIDGKKYYHAIIRDVSERKKTDSRISLMNRLLAAISEINQTAIKETDIINFFERACGILVGKGIFKMAWAGIIDFDAGVVSSIASAGEGTEAVSTFSFRDPPVHALLQKVITGGKYIVIEDLVTSKISERGVANARQFGYQSAGAFPLMLDGKMHGVLVVYTGKGETILDEEADLLNELAADISFAVHYNSQLMEKDKLQMQLVQTAKMSAVGQLAAGVAHEINNPMTAILGYTQLLLKEFNPGEHIYEKLKIVETEALRCKNIVKQLLAFSRTKQINAELTDLHKLIEDVLVLVEDQLKVNNIRIERKYGVDIPDVFVPRQLEQVILNLVTNARDAMPKGGRITISTETEGEKVALRFADTGSGISKENLKSIFEPFFTTKQTGQGTGLGLAIVKDMLEKMNGDITVASEPGKDTVFTVILPVKKNA